ncbi:family 16 glycosylhydrolase [Pseudoxanthomonas sp. LjRoot143]|uniref:family 16 glycosylhydrolase n=1 Tax=Pseudoxanthomonas sp. LjRoot143 TaxID=3342266 RepID=UPI003ECF05A9
MNIRDVSGAFSRLIFSLSRSLVSLLPARRILAFGMGEARIGAIMVINLDRQPQRWQRVCRELARFRTFEGTSLLSITRRLAAVDARDGRAVAATGDVDTIYRIGDQLHVQPDPRLLACFGPDELVRMTRQEVAVARSHVEVWKAIVAGADDYVLVLEDDVWFRRDAATLIDQGWSAAHRHCGANEGPKLIYFSYDDAGGTAERINLDDVVFRPVRGLWFLSGYVLSREGAATLLRAMPVVGPVDLWMNFRFEALGALALHSPVILQRQDAGSDNSYSILPYLARAGTIDAGPAPGPPTRDSFGPLVAWTSGGLHESLAMALSMLGLRVRVYDGDEEEIQAHDLPLLFGTFDAIVDPPLAPGALSTTIADSKVKFLLESPPLASRFGRLPNARTLILSPDASNGDRWLSICAFLGLDRPAEAFPMGAERGLRVFRDDRSDAARRALPDSIRGNAYRLDPSPWVLPPRSDWRPSPPSAEIAPDRGQCLADATTARDRSPFRTLVETFPGNLASFGMEGVVHQDDGLHLTLSKGNAVGGRRYRSGAFASINAFGHGRFEAVIKAASGPGLVTGFFLHRSQPRQEIDIELAGGDPTGMLVNVYFNPGDEGANMAFGYRGTPCRIELGFDATEEFHRYTIDWRPGYIAWSVDGRVVHKRVGWDPTPLPHLPMCLHANLWAPRSEELAGTIDEMALPSTAIFRHVSAWS